MENLESQNEREEEQNTIKSIDDEDLKNETTEISDEEKPTQDEKEGSDGTEEEEKDSPLEVMKEEGEEGKDNEVSVGESVTQNTFPKEEDTAVEGVKEDQPVGDDGKEEEEEEEKKEDIPSEMTKEDKEVPVGITVEQDIHPIEACKKDEFDVTDAPCVESNCELTCDSSSIYNTEDMSTTKTDFSSGQNVEVNGENGAQMNGCIVFECNGDSYDEAKSEATCVTYDKDIKVIHASDYVEIVLIGKDVTVVVCNQGGVSASEGSQQESTSIPFRRQRHGPRSHRRCKRRPIHRTNKTASVSTAVK
ncbi:unnamed protein product [Hymenolepis diminuta]|uniref:Midasin n=1 Tax=Hymenolepis diminuta TaxID=6216 RepID=A0A0R3SXW1_HYMDI|nr:unnamed protein product [Hymenolepis diminuta]